jgi:uncharacterized protein YjbI with pentapeptide repeats
MRIVKPMCLSVLSRPYEFKREFNLGVAVLAFMPIQDEPVLLPETAMWAFLGDNLPGDVPVDAGMPKQSGEFVAIAKAFAPGGEPVSALRAGIALGERVKTVNVTGDRLWDGREATPPTPFTAMPIDWEHAYGGADYPENPSGIGADTGKATREQPVRLPNIGNPAADRARHAGFGPISLTWPQRAALCGTHDAAWLQDHFPGYPPDIDWRFFNIAPSDQQFPAPLTGRESYAFENLHPARGLITGALPGIAPRLFVTRGAGGSFEEVKLALTTVWFFPHLERMVLVHHGSVRVAEEDASDIEYLAAGVNAADAPRPAADYVEEFRRRLDRTAAGAQRALNDKLLAPPAWVAPDAAIEAMKAQMQGEGIVLGRIRSIQVRQHEKMRAKLAARGIDPDKHMPPLPPEEPLPAPEDIPAYMEAKRAEAEAARQAVEDKIAAMEAEQAAKGNDISAQLAKRHAKPKGPPSYSAKSMRAQLTAQAAAFRLRGIYAAMIEDMLANPDSDATWREIEAKLRDAYRLGAHHQDPADPADPARNEDIRAWLTGAAAPPADADIYDFHGADLAWLQLSGKKLAGICLDGARLAGANLTRADLRNSVLAHAGMAAAKLDNADLTGANLGRADLTGASFRGAAMKNAILAGANLTDARFEGADLESAAFSEAIFTGARFDGARAPAMMMVKTNLPRFHAPGMVLDGASFIGVDLSGAVFNHASMAGVSFIDCVVDGVNFTGANLAKAAFAGTTTVNACQFSFAALSGANFRGRAMRNCDFSQAEMAQADFSGAVLTNAVMFRAHAAGARFTAADLRTARLNHGNFSQADLARADLRGADLTDGEFYEANLARVKLDEKTIRAGMRMKRMRYLPLAQV